MPATVLLARFQHFYPGLYESPRYRTSGHVIPAPLFWIYQRRMGATMALERMNLTRAVAHAVGLLFAKPGSGESSLTRGELREAYLDGGRD